MKLIFCAFVIHFLLGGGNKAFSEEREHLNILTTIPKVGYIKYSGLFKSTSSQYSIGFSQHWGRKIYDIPKDQLEFSFYWKNEYLINSAITTKESLFPGDQEFQVSNISIMTPTFCGRSNLSIDVCASAFVALDFFSNTGSYMYLPSFFVDFEMSYIIGNGFITTIDARFSKNTFKLNDQAFEYSSRMINVGLGYGF